VNQTNPRSNVAPSMFNRAFHDFATADKFELVTISLGVIVALYHLLHAFIIVQGSTRHYITHVGVMTLLALLVLYRDKLRQATRMKRFILVLTIIMVLLPTIYVFVNSDRLEGLFGTSTNLDAAMGVIVMFGILSATWLLWGPTFPIIISIFTAYFLWGHLISGPLYHVHFDFKYVISYLAIGLGTGIYGNFAPISANLVIYFMLFGAMIQLSGVMPSFIELGKVVARFLRGGPAYMAFIGSSLVAMISGSGAGNVVITGTFTIPAMKRAGFPPHEAAATEAVCSAGGQLTPPVMGAATFIMAHFIGVPYIIIVQKAIIGAILYYAAIFIGLLFFCYSTGKERIPERFDGKVILKRFPIFLVGISVLIFMLLRLVSVGYACAIAMAVTLLLALIMAPESRSLKVIAKGLAQGAMWGAQVGVILFAVGMVATGIISTGLGPKAASAIISLTQGLLIPSLFVIAVITIIMGMGVPISAAYMITAILLIPSLWLLGVEMFASHFFAFYFAMFATLTPPVAVTALVASRVAGASFWRTGWSSMRLIILPFLFPFVICLHPTLLNFPFFGWKEFMLIGVFILATISVAAAAYGWFVKNLRVYMRLFTALSSLGLIAFLFDLGTLYLTIGLVLLALVVLIQLRAFYIDRGKQRAALQTS